MTLRRSTAVRVDSVPPTRTGVKLTRAQFDVDSLSLQLTCPPGANEPLVFLSLSTFLFHLLTIWELKRQGWQFVGCEINN